MAADADRLPLLLTIISLVHSVLSHSNHSVITTDDRGLLPPTWTDYSNFDRSQDSGLFLFDDFDYRAADADEECDLIWIDQHNQAQYVKLPDLGSAMQQYYLLPNHFAKLVRFRDEIKDHHDPDPFRYSNLASNDCIENQAGLRSNYCSLSKASLSSKSFVSEYITSREELNRGVYTNSQIHIDVAVITTESNVIDMGISPRLQSALFALDHDNEVVIVMAEVGFFAEMISVITSHHEKSQMFWVLSNLKKKVNAKTEPSPFLNEDFAQLNEVMSKTFSTSTTPATVKVLTLTMTIDNNYLVEPEETEFFEKKLTKHSPHQVLSMLWKTHSTLKTAPITISAIDVCGDDNSWKVWDYLAPVSSSRSSLQSTESSSTLFSSSSRWSSSSSSSSASSEFAGSCPSRQSPSMKCSPDICSREASVFDAPSQSSSPNYLDWSLDQLLSRGSSHSGCASLRSDSSSSPPGSSRFLSSAVGSLSISPSSCSSFKSLGQMYSLTVDHLHEFVQNSKLVKIPEPHEINIECVFSSSQPQKRQSRHSQAFQDFYECCPLPDHLVNYEEIELRQICSHDFMTDVSGVHGVEFSPSDDQIFTFYNAETVVKDIEHDNVAGLWSEISDLGVSVTGVLQSLIEAYDRPAGSGHRSNFSDKGIVRPGHNSRITYGAYYKKSLFEARSVFGPCTAILRGPTFSAAVQASISGLNAFVVADLCKAEATVCGVGLGVGLSLHTGVSLGIHSIGLSLAGFGLSIGSSMSLWTPVATISL